jgi:hypothetical protein
VVKRLRAVVMMVAEVMAASVGVLVEGKGLFVLAERALV